MIVALDGGYYAYGMEMMIVADPYDIQVAHSQDLVNWSWEGFVDIDSMAFDDLVSGKKLLYWESGFESIWVRELDDDRMGAGSEPTPVLAPTTEPYGNLSEGAWGIYREGTYFPVYSGDNCCSELANYAVMVARAQDPFGPFERLGDVERTNRSVVLKASTIWKAPGHDLGRAGAAGDDWMVYHAIDRERPRRETGTLGVQWGWRVMLADRIRVREGLTARLRRAAVGGQCSARHRQERIVMASSAAPSSNWSVGISYPAVSQSVSAWRKHSVRRFKYSFVAGGERWEGKRVGKSAGAVTTRLIDGCANMFEHPNTMQSKHFNESKDARGAASDWPATPTVRSRPRESGP